MLDCDWSSDVCSSDLGAVIHPDFLLFASFLKIVGPRPSKAHTLDRIDNSDPEYAPGKVKWHDKFAQANNKSTNVTLTDNNGVTKTIAQWAHFKKVSPSTISKRLAKGWDAHSAIHGKPLAKSKVVAWSDTPWPLGREAWLEENYANRSEAESKMSRESWFVARQEFNVSRAQHDVASAVEAHRDLSTGDGGQWDLADEYALALKTLEHAEKQLARQQAAYESAKAHLQWAKARSAARAKGAVALQKFLAKHPRPDRIALPVVPD
jgi:hypothetical protein